MELRGLFLSFYKLPLILCAGKQRESDVSAVLISGVLALIAAIHVLWAFGITWPAPTARDLAQRVAGFEGQHDMPPPLACIAVAVILMIGAGLALAVSGILPKPGPDWMYHLAIWGMAAVFAARGIAAYTKGWRALTPVEPFATYDRRYYGPLCLILAALTATLALGN